MPSKSETSVECFTKGFNCAQAVFSAYAPLFGLKETDALRISAGFGAGLGRLQEVCGAVTGAVMVIGCRHGMTLPDDHDAREKTYALVQQFTRRFRLRHGSILCRDLLCCDLNTEEGKKRFKDNNLKEQCTVYVQDAATMLEEMV